MLTDGVNPDRSMPVVAFCSNGIGDHILAAPAIRALSSLFPSALVNVGPPALAPTLLSEVPFARTISLGAGCRAFDSKAIARSVGACGIFVCFDRAITESHIALAKSLGASTLGFSAAFDAWIHLDPSLHSVDQAFSLIRLLNPGVPLGPFSYPLHVGASSESLAASFRRAIGEDNKMVICHSDTSPEKMWDPDRFAELIDRLVASRPNVIVGMLGGKTGTRALGRPHPRKLDLTCLPLSVSIALAASCDAVIAVDSCILHAADLARVPLVALFRAMNMAQFEPRFTPKQVTISAEFVNGIAVDSVLEAINDLI